MTLAPVVLELKVRDREMQIQVSTPQDMRLHMKLCKGGVMQKMESLEVVLQQFPNSE